MNWDPRTRFGQWVKNVLIGFDQLGNAVWGGDPDETISSRLGKMERAGRLRWGPRVLARMLNRIDPGHCQDAIEHYEGKDATHDRGL